MNIRISPDSRWYNYSKIVFLNLNAFYLSQMMNMMDIVRF